MKHILVVDDDAHMTTLLRDFLQKQGYSVTTTFSVEGALTWLDSKINRPDLILSDVKMGAVSGIELVKKLAIERPTIPVILFSVFEELEKEALRMGAKKFLGKPFSLGELSQAVAEQLCEKNGGMAEKDIHSPEKD